MASSLPTAHTASTLERLRAGNRRYAAGSFSAPPIPHSGRPIAVVVCPPDWPIPPYELFGLAPEALYVLQGDFHADSEDLVAGLELAVNPLGLTLAVILGGEISLDGLCARTARLNLHVVRATLGPNDIVRFESGVAPLGQIRISK